MYTCSRVYIPIRTRSWRLALTVLAAVASALLQLGYSQLKPEQKQVVEAFLASHDVLMSLPIGSGKSLCYSLLINVFNTLRGCNTSVVIVVSLLTVLMQDQVQSLIRLGLRATIIFGGMDSSTRAVSVQESTRFSSSVPSHCLGTRK